MRAFLVCLSGLLLFAQSSLPYGARVAIIDYADEWTKNAGLGEALNVMGIIYDDLSARRHIHISSLSSDRKKKALILGSMATNNPQVRDALAMNISVSDIRDFVKEGGVIIELMQSARDEAEVEWLPEELSFSRGDSNTPDMTILQPEHRLLNVPNKITEEHLKLMRLTNVSGGIVKQSGFQVLVAEGENGAQPVIMAAEYGYGEFIFLSLAPDKLCAIGQASGVREVAVRLMQNLVAYATGFNAVDDEGKLMVKSDVEPVIWLESQSSIRSVCFSPDGRFLAAGPIQGGSGIKLWDMKTGTEVEGIRGMAEYISFSPDGRYLALSGVTGMKIWDVEARQEIRFPDSIRVVGRHCFSPDGKLLAIQSQNPLDPRDPRKTAIELWDVSSRKKIRSLEPSGLGSSICFSPDGEVLVSGNTIWDVATGQMLSTSHGQTTALRFSSDGNILTSAGRDGKIVFWDVVTGKDVWKKVKDISGDSFRRAVSLSPDLELVAFACDYDETPATERLRRRREQIRSPKQVGLYVIKLFETETGREVKALAGHTDEITALDFSPDGELLASASRDGKLLLWKITPSAELIAIASDIATASIIKHQTIIDKKDMEEYDAKYEIAQSHEALAETYAELGLESAAADERRLATRVQFSESHYQEYLKKTQQPAIEDYMREIQSQQAVISGNPGSEDATRAKYLVGKLYQKMHNYQKAINIYQELARERREIRLSTLAIQAIGTSLFDRAKSEFEAGANQAAISSLNEALEGKENMSWAAEARRLLADIYLLEKDERLALQEYKKLMKVHPSSRWVFLRHVRGGKPSPSDASDIVADLEQKLDEE